MLWLLGPATHVYATLDWTDAFGEPTDCGFVVSLRHASGATSTTSSSKLNRLSSRELRAYDTAGSYDVRSTDVQAQALFAGIRPTDDRASWGSMPPNAGARSSPRRAVRSCPPPRATMRRTTRSSRRPFTKVVLGQ
jgi:hypothetical protein